MAAEQHNVLVTGASGFIGRATVALLKRRGWRVACGSRTTSSSPDHVPIDLDRPVSLLQLTGARRFDAIVHLAARVDLSLDAESRLYVPNVLATGCLAHVAERSAAHMIFASTAIVHGVSTESIDANTAVSPDTPYARSKWLGELLIAASGARHSILRLGGVFGARGPGHLGINRAIEAALGGEPPRQIGEGRARRNYIYVHDVAAAIVDALERKLEGTHLVAGHETLSVAEMLQAICIALAPDHRPSRNAGKEASDQIIVPSPSLPHTRGFAEALAHMTSDGGRIS